MAASRKPLNVDAAVLAPMRGKRVAVGLSGGMDSVALLHALHALAPRLGYRLSAIHVNHGLSPNANGWEKFCGSLCRELDVPFKSFRVKVRKGKEGLEAAAREARRAAMSSLKVDAIALAHHLDDQAETVLLNLLRGAGVAGASGMAKQARLGAKLLLRPLLGVSRADIAAYAAAHRLAWIEDESNADEALTRNFLRRRVGPLLATRFPRWRENLARAARHFGGAQADAQGLLRAYLKGKGLRAPSEAKLLEMLRQLGGKGGNVRIDHDGATLRRYRDNVVVVKGEKDPPAFRPRSWKGEARLALPALGGELRFRSARGRGIDRRRLKAGALQVRLRSGGERLQVDAHRPRRTLKNLFQEASVPPWERARMPLLYCGEDLVWVPGLGVAADYRAAKNGAGILPEWRRSAS